LSETLHIKFPRELRRARIVAVTQPKGTAPHRCKDGNPGGLIEEIQAVQETAFKEGCAHAEAAWVARFSELFQGLEEEAARLCACRRAFEAAMEKNVVELGLAVAEKFLFGERERRAYSIKAIVRSVLERLDVGEAKLTIALHPKDLERLSEEGGLGQEAEFSNLRFVNDPDLPRAGCRIDTGFGHASFSLEEQMEEIRKLLKETEIPCHESSGD
jgi:flagellar biosynthesis/type III secretory pathway protein FliH